MNRRKKGPTHLAPPSRRVRFLPAGAFALSALVGSGTLEAAPSSLAPEVGYSYGEIETPRALALGGAVRARSSSLEALYLNPANLSASRVYHVGAQAQFASGVQRQSFGAAVVDSIVSRSKLAGGLSVDWVFQDPDGADREALSARFALALVASDQLLLGASARYLELSQEGYPRNVALIEPSIFSAGLDGEPLVRELTVDAGVTLRPTPFLSLSAVGYNLTNPGHAFLPLTSGVAVGIGAQQFTLESDVLFDFTTYEDTELRALVGAEFLAAGRYPLRAGYRYDAGLGSHAFSLGAGYTDPGYSFDFALRRTLGDLAHTQFTLGLKFHVESMGLLTGYQ